MPRRPPIDTSEFMSRYHHPKNIAASNGGHAEGQWATITTAYSKSKGMYRQKQVDDEIDRIRSFKRPSSSKITITIDGDNLLKVYHHHHHCLDIQLTGGRNGKGRVVWFWTNYETATDERVMKGAIAALDSSWIDPKGVGSSDGNNSGRDRDRGTKATAAAVASFFHASAGEKRKRAADAADSRARGRVDLSQEVPGRAIEDKKIEVIDLTD